MTPASSPSAAAASPRMHSDPRTGRTTIVAESYTAALDAARLVLAVSSGGLEYEFRLAGVLTAHPAGQWQGPPVEEGRPGTAIVERSGSLLILRLPLDGALAGKTMILDFKERHFTYRLGVTAAQDLDVADVDYGADASGTSRSAFDAFFLWCPDRYQSRLPSRQTVELKLASTRQPEEGFFRGDVGKYLVAPTVAALTAQGTWAGFATMEVPSSQLGLHLIASRQDFHLNFRFSHNLRAAAGSTCLLPEIGFFFHLQRDGVLADYISTLYRTGLAPRPSTWADWWAEPIYCNYADQVYSHTLSSGIMKDEAGSLDNCSEEFLSARMETLRREGIPWGTLIIDFGWMDFLGDYRPHTARFPDLRGFIDRLHLQGKRVLLWFAPFFCETGSRMAVEHPDWFLRQRDGAPSEYAWMQRRILTPDFTHPAVREHLRTVIAFLLGQGPGCVNADGFKIDGYSFLPDVDRTFHDPSWGVGDRFQHRADKFVYDEAKRVRADALVENSFANPFFNDTQDLCRLNDASSYDTDLYEERAWVAWLSGVAVPDTDDWSAFRKLLVPSTLRKSVYGIPALYAIEHRGTGRMGGASGGYPVGITPDEYRKVAAILKCYQHAPLRPDQERFIDPDLKVFWRKFGSGPLRGSFAAIALAGNTAIATYSPTRILLAAITDTQVVVPIPRGFRVAAVREHGAGPSTREPRHQAAGADLLLWMRPTGVELDHYEIDLAQERG